MEIGADQASIRDARNTILKADLTVIEHKILVDFIEQAENPAFAARAVLQGIQHSSESAKDILSRLLQEWKELVSTVVHSALDETPDPSFTNLLNQRDQSRCVLVSPRTQQLVSPEPTLIMPPHLLNILQEGQNDKERPWRSLLDIFLTPSGTSRLVRLLFDRSAQGMLANSLLLSPEASNAFRNGHLEIWKRPDQVIAAAEGPARVKYRIQKLYPEPYDREILLSDGSYIPEYDSLPFHVQTENVVQYPLPDPFLLQVHCHFVNALHQFRLVKSVAKPWPPEPRESFLDRSVRFLIRHLCPILPRFVRTYFWLHLFRIGETRYPRDISPIVQRLPFGLYAKSSGRSHGNEPVTLQLLQRHAPSVPVPRLVDVFTMPPDYGFGAAHDNWFVMTAVPGERVENVLYRMSYAERKQLAEDMTAALRRVHSIPNPSDYRYASPLGGPIFDWRLGGGEHGCGPYATDDQFNKQLAGGIPLDYLRQQVSTAFTWKYDDAPILSHGDLFLSNVLVIAGRFSGFVDWEQAAFMPPYWDFVKVMRTSLRKPDAQALYRLIWGHAYDKELATERHLWTCFPWGGTEVDVGLGADQAFHRRRNENRLKRFTWTRRLP